MATQPSRGPRSVADQMSADMHIDYELKREWLQEQHELKTLPHGWQTQVAGELGVSSALVSQVLRRHHISPRVLEAMHTYAMRTLKQAAPDDVVSAVINAERTVDLLREQENKLELQLEGQMNAQAAEQERLELRWFSKISKTEDALAGIRARLEQALKDWEEIELNAADLERLEEVVLNPQGAAAQTIAERNAEIAKLSIEERLALADLRDEIRASKQEKKAGENLDGEDAS